MTSIALFRGVVLHKPLTRRAMVIFNVVCWVVPVLYTVLPLTTQSLGEITGGYVFYRATPRAALTDAPVRTGSCWIVEQPPGFMWQLGFFFPTVWGLIIVMGVLTITALVYASRTRQQLSSNKRALAGDFVRLALYPAVYALCNIFNTANRIYTVAYGETTTFLAVSDRLVVSIGFWNCLIFLSMPQIRREVWSRCCRRCRTTDSLDDVEHKQLEAALRDRLVGRSDFFEGMQDSPDLSRSARQTGASQGSGSVTTAPLTGVSSGASGAIVGLALLRSDLGASAGYVPPTVSFAVDAADSLAATVVSPQRPLAPQTRGYASRVPARTSGGSAGTAVSGALQHSASGGTLGAPVDATVSGSPSGAGLGSQVVSATDSGILSVAAGGSVPSLDLLEDSAARDSLRR